MDGQNGDNGNKQRIGKPNLLMECTKCKERCIYTRIYEMIVFVLKIESSNKGKQLKSCSKRKIDSHSNKMK